MDLPDFAKESVAQIQILCTFQAQRNFRRAIHKELGLSRRPSPCESYPASALTRASTVRPDRAHERLHLSFLQSVQDADDDVVEERGNRPDNPGTFPVLGDEAIAHVPAR